MNAAQISTKTLPGVVGLTLRLGPSQGQNDEKAPSPHPVLHPASPWEIREDGRGGDEGGRVRGEAWRDARFKRGTAERERERREVVEVEEEEVCF